MQESINLPLNAKKLEACLFSSVLLCYIQNTFLHEFCISDNKQSNQKALYSNHLAWTNPEGLWNLNVMKDMTSMNLQNKLPPPPKKKIIIYFLTLWPVLSKSLMKCGSIVAKLRWFEFPEFMIKITIKLHFKIEFCLRDSTHWTWKMIRPCKRQQWRNPKWNVRNKSNKPSANSHSIFSSRCWPPHILQLLK